MKKYTKPEVEVISFESKNDMMVLSLNSTGKNDNSIGIWDLKLPEIDENNQ